MKIIHRIAAESGGPFWKAIDWMGIAYERGSWCVLNISEDHDRWPEVSKLEANLQPGTHLITNKYTMREIKSAEWFEVSAKGHHGYPQPEDGYVSSTYDTENLCHRCGVGASQKSPFRLRSEPTMKRTKFLQLNWVFDEYFVLPQVVSGLADAGITGAEFLPPVLHKTGEPCRGVSQMRVKSVLPGGLMPPNLEQTVCVSTVGELGSAIGSNAKIADSSEYCGRSKYQYMHRGPFMFKRQTFENAPDLVKSREWFGSGTAAHRLVLVSKRFRDLFVSKKWRGLEFEPVQLVDRGA